MRKKFNLSSLGLEAEIGKFARQADGSVFLRSGDNVVLSTVVASKEDRDFMGFLPLTVEYRERTSSVGKFPGGYIKREGRLNDVEILVSRLIDRSIRPLFPKYYFNEMQLLSTVFSADGKFPTSVLGVIAASLALTISDIPFMGPIGIVKASRIGGEWKFNVGIEDFELSDANITVVGTQSGICMVEGFSDNLLEKDLVDILFKSEKHIKEQIDWQLEIQKDLGIKKIEKKTTIDWENWERQLKDFLRPELLEPLFIAGKKERNFVFDRLKKSVFGYFSDDLKSNRLSSAVLAFLFDAELKRIIPDLVTKKNKRLDLRAFDEVRPIEVEVATLPCVHGSSLFQRGETQVLASLTLGTSQDVQRVEPLLGSTKEKTFMIHYNFPPFATGEIRPMRGVSRREIGHGSLAEISFKNILPSKEDFPYTIRSVADVLESNGSSSMASVCSTTMALMDAGVPIKEMVGGIAMGLIQDSSGQFQILTDILGIEDGMGLMDFKITGTEKGIMAIQMDVKLKSGLSSELMGKALEQARVARLHILGEMKKVLSSPREELSKNAPSVSSFRIDKERIGALIGPGGKNIKEIIAQTEVQMDVEDDGLVNVFAKDKASADRATQWAKTLVGDIEVGSVYDGIVNGITDFGMFVELVPGKNGLVHISSMSVNKKRTFAKDYKVGDKIKVKVLRVDREMDRVGLEASDLASD